MDHDSITPVVTKGHGAIATQSDAVYDATIDGLGYRACPLTNEYIVIRSRYISRNRYTVAVDKSGVYTVQKHTASTPISNITFRVELQGDTCKIVRDYGNVKAQYTIMRHSEGYELDCSQDDVLAKLPGYTFQKLNADAGMAFNSGIFTMALEEMQEDEWVKA